jgi:hypothetical protein
MKDSKEFDEEYKNLPPSPASECECDCWSWSKVRDKWTCDHCGSTTSFGESYCESPEDNDPDIDQYHDHCSEVEFYRNRHGFDGE